MMPAKAFASFQFYKVRLKRMIETKVTEAQKDFNSTKFD